MYKVLIVDDDKNNREVVHDALEDEGYQMLEAGDGHEALAVINEKLPDLVLLDIMMPRIDGLMVLKDIKSSEKTQHINVVMLTALNTDMQITECLNVGATDYVTKPFSTMVLRAKVRAALRTPSAPAEPESAVPSTTPSERGRVISFIGAKGGVGATTTALNVAASLATNDRDVNYCELRPDFSTAALQMRMRSAITFGPLLAKKPANISQADVENLLTQHGKGLQLLLSPAGTGHANTDKSNTDKSNTSMTNTGTPHEVSAEHAEVIVEKLAHLAELTIIDAPRFPEKVARAVLRRSDYVAIVCELEPLSWEATKAMLAKLNSWEIHNNTIGVVVICRARVTSHLILGEIRDSLACDLIAVIPPDPDECHIAVKDGVPLVLHRPDNIVAESLKTLAERVASSQVRALTF